MGGKGPVSAMRIIVASAALTAANWESLVPPKIRADAVYGLQGDLLL